jgi:hypothetical protein
MPLRLSTEQSDGRIAMGFSESASTARGSSPHTRVILSSRVLPSAMGRSKTTSTFPAPECVPHQFLTV